MKPTKCRVFCKDCGRSKMVFETEKKAETFIKFNSEEIAQASGIKPERSYFCTYCGGWHVTSKQEYLNAKSRTEIIIDLFKEEKEKKKLAGVERGLMIEQERAKLKEKLRETVCLLEAHVKSLQGLDINAPNYCDTLRCALTELENLQLYNGIAFKGSDKRIQRVHKKITLIKNQSNI